MQKLVVLISGSGTNLQAMICAQLAGQFDGEIAAVISNKANAKGLQRAQDAGIKAIHLDPKAYADRESYDLALADIIEEQAADLIVMAGFMRILSDGFVQRFAGKMLNIHPSLLPKYQGLHTHQRAIDAGDEEHGCSVHFVTAELDGGPVVIQAKVPVFSDDNPEILAERVLTQEHAIYPLAVNWFLKGRLVMTDNRAQLDNKTLPEQGYAAS